MCGIDFFARFSSIPSNINQFDNRSKEINLFRKEIQRRGPSQDSNLQISLPLNEDNSFLEIEMYSSVLHLRGVHMAQIKQPCYTNDDSKWVLQWNGEIYDGIEGLTDDCNDTE